MRTPAALRGRPALAPAPARSTRRRTLLAVACVLVAFASIAGRLLQLAARGGGEFKLGFAEPLTRTYSRPDLLDRHGRLLATDISVHSLYADPQAILDLDETVERLSAALSLDAAELRKTLGERGRRFVWVARGLSPRQAKRAHDLGLPGLLFRNEPRRLYPMGALAGHSLGSVNIDNRGIAGIERMLDEANQVEEGEGPAGTRRQPLRLSLDVGVQHAVGAELAAAMDRYAAFAAVGLILDADSGEVLSAVSLPEVDPARATDWLDPLHADRLLGGTFELGSVFKTLTIATALESGTADLDTLFDVRQPLIAGPYTITDLHPQGRPLSVREIFLHSSNVGAGMMALKSGPERQRAFLDRLGLLKPLHTEAGSVAAPLLPKHWGRAETITIAYGHGLALAPLQFAAAFATLINGGSSVTPTFLAQPEVGAARQRTRLVSSATSAKLREILRLNVTNSAGTGRRAEVEAYRVGGKTGTAELPSRGGYRKRAVISSFIGAFPMDAPRYVTLVSLFEPQRGEGSPTHITAAQNAAPVTARIIERVAPLLGVLPRRVETAASPGREFDALRPAQ